jgi:Tol biopolymer transport system component/DNA-binding winged helix-turn-helix (wHTH) protein
VQDTFRIAGAYDIEPSLNRVTGPNGITRLEPKVMQVLVCLAARAGQMVPKDRLLHAAWPDTAVGDDVLTRAISELRRLFDDDSKQPRIIETIPKSGYRLIAPVREPQPAEPKADAAVAVGRPGNRVVIATLFSLITIAVTAGWFLRSRGEVKTPAPRPPRLVQLTMLRGLETSPTFSPDGTQVAFSWNGENEDNFDIYVKFVGSSELRRLTTDPAPDVSPAWSPDGRQIAFVRASAKEGDATIRLVSPLGGADRKLSDFRVNASGPDSTPIAWSPDGRWVAASRDVAAAGAGVSVIPVSGGAPRALTHARAPAWHSGVAFSPEGRRFAYASCAGLQTDLPACDVHVIDLGTDSVPVSASRQLTNQGMSIHGLAWTRDGSSIIYDTAGRGPYYLWRVMADGTREPERIEVAGFGSHRPATVLSRDRLAFDRRLPTLGVYRVLPGQSPQPVLVSSAFDFEPDFSPDGQRLAFSSRRSGDAVEIWLASADGSGPQQLTHGPGPRQGAPAWSPDGRRIAFESLRADGHFDVWVMDSDGSALHQLTTDPGDENAPTWSRDGQQIYFSSDRAGGRDIWRVPAGGGRLTRVTHGGSGVVARETLDGSAIVYQSAMGDSPLMLLPLTGGPARQLAACVKIQGYIAAKSLAAGAAGIYYGQCGSGPESSIHLVDPATGRDREVGRVSDPFFLSALAISPDGRTILVHRGMETADLVLIENFR